MIIPFFIVLGVAGLNSGFNFPMPDMATCEQVAASVWMQSFSHHYRTTCYAVQPGIIGIRGEVRQMPKNWNKNQTDFCAPCVQPSWHNDSGRIQ